MPLRQTLSAVGGRSALGEGSFSTVGGGMGRAVGGFLTPAGSGGRLCACPNGLFI